ncbi:hypothetical protein EVAR_55299_1 [Eumeta japonica]|uniref:Uncharacterized protein n=1 Tax=Eumeta variegata TaxID=151549 RepID=A0A4C1ZKF9_EUMVA|nr:hypothetical protein EVAR_55299_1 [Eumeta japonica]
MNVDLTEVNVLRHRLTGHHEGVDSSQKFGAEPAPGSDLCPILIAKIKAPAAGKFLESSLRLENFSTL